MIELLYGPATAGMTAPPPPLAVGYLLVSPWQPIVLLLPVLGWAWLVSTVFDKQAARFYLGRENWNLIHLIIALIAVIGSVSLPIPGIAGFVAGFFLLVILLAADVLAFVVITNKDERVPEHQRLTLDFSKWAEARASKKDAKQQGTSTLQLNGPTGPVSVPKKEDPAFNVRVGAEQLVIAGLTVRASQVDLGPTSSSSYAVSFLVDGVRQAGEKLPAAEAVQMIDFWKGAAGLDVSDRRRKLSGTLSARTEAETTKIKLTTSGSQAGMKLSIIFNPSQAVTRSFDDLGLGDAQAKVVRSWVGEEPGGVVVLAAPSDSGRTTTLYTLMKQHDAYTSNVQSLELETEDALEGIKQLVFEGGDDAPEFAVQLRSMLRRDPDVVGVAELPDPDTAKEIARADLERSRVYLSMRADSGLAALQVYAKAVGDPKLAAKGLRGAIAQRLMRRLCENCRVPYSPPADILKKVGLPADKVKQLYKKGGQVMMRNKPEICPVCNGAGFSGQVGVFEVLPMGEAEKALMAKGDWSGLKQELRKRQLPMLQQAALRKAVEGATSLEEINRVMSSSAPKKKSSGGSSTKKTAATG
ncbi:MAG: type II secretory ATPase GspE/PulE/Tfp pilus assembly ATPase PilB-like protein [Phycisphaerales bacterium]|jgi:type II secretory ATPase GspE/PulE/Tfp pilus assembly ATPase PilB-like protein